MTRIEIQNTLRAGKKVTHKYFGEKEFVQMYSLLKNVLIDENGILLDWDEFWYYRKESIFDEGWEIFTKT